MPFNLSAIAYKLIGIAVVVAIVGGIILAQHLKINSQARTIAEQRVQVVTLKATNDHQFELIDQLTQDKAAFEKRAAVAEAAKRKAEVTANAKVAAALKRITEHATPQDNAPVFGALRDSLGIVRGQ